MKRNRSDNFEGMDYEDHFEEIKKLMHKMHAQGYYYSTIAEMVSAYAYKMEFDPAMQEGAEK